VEELWKFAIGLTGISGIGAFVLFSLYKEWIKAPVIFDLTNKQKHDLLRLFLKLTFIFAIATLLSAAYDKYISSTKESISLSQLKDSVNSSYDYGQRIIDEKIKDPSLTNKDKGVLSGIKNNYEVEISNAKKALEDNNLSLWREKNNLIKRILGTDDSKKYLPSDLSTSVGSLPEESVNKYEIMM
jgi:hypothetical protein